MPDTDKPDNQIEAGIIIVDKPAGRSSMSAVAQVRRLANRTKTGHAGTLDPLATGVLVMALGKSTKLIEQLMATTKRYRTEIDLSAFTTTDDAEGVRTEIVVPTPPSREMVDDAIASFVGTFDQRPPDFSAIKVNGKRAYKEARDGKQVQLPARPVTLFDAKAIAYQWPLVTVELHTGKGFYVRSFARDLGTKLHTGGTCKSLRRTAVGPFTEDESHELESLPCPLDVSLLLTPEVAIDRVNACHDEGAGDVRRR